MQHDEDANEGEYTFDAYEDATSAVPEVQSDIKQTFCHIHAE